VTGPLVSLRTEREIEPRPVDDRGLSHLRMRDRSGIAAIIAPRPGIFFRRTPFGTSARPVSTTYADDPALRRRPTPAWLGGGEERTLGRCARLAPEAERVVARRHTGDDERDARNTSMSKAEWPNRKDSAIARRPGRPLHKTGTGERNRDEVDPDSREWRVSHGRGSIYLLPPMCAWPREPQREICVGGGRSREREGDRGKPAETAPTHVSRLRVDGIDRSGAALALCQKSPHVRPPLISTIRLDAGGGSCWALS
jgi:hypothetical protein